MLHRSTGCSSRQLQLNVGFRKAHRNEQDKNITCHTCKEMWPRHKRCWKCLTWASKPELLKDTYSCTFSRIIKKKLFSGYLLLKLYVGKINIALYYFNIIIWTVNVLTSGPRFLLVRNAEGNVNLLSISSDDYR